MVDIDLKTAVRHWPQALRRPRWAWVFATQGRAGLFREVVRDSIKVMHTAPELSGLEEISRTTPISPIGKMGGTQEYLYHLICLLRPNTVVETGVFRGISSAFILSALSRNRRGRLYSIDLPGASYEMPDGGRDTSNLPPGEKTGFVVPESLRERWTLVLGDSKSELVPLLSKLGEIDMFLHDSEHTYECMMWEYSSAWPFIRPGGVLASDDIGWNRAFDEFVSAHATAPVMRIKGKLGIAKKAEHAPQSRGVF